MHHDPSVSFPGFERHVSLETGGGELNLIPILFLDRGLGSSNNSL
jgi:hypothetical protein